MKKTIRAVTLIFKSTTCQDDEVRSFIFDEKEVRGTAEALGQAIISSNLVPGMRLSAYAIQQKVFDVAEGDIIPALSAGQRWKAPLSMGEVEIIDISSGMVHFRYINSNMMPQSASIDLFRKAFSTPSVVDSDKNKTVVSKYQIWATPEVDSYACVCQVDKIDNSNSSITYIAYDKRVGRSAIMRDDKFLHAYPEFIGYFAEYKDGDKPDKPVKGLLYRGVSSGELAYVTEVSGGENSPMICYSYISHRDTTVHRTTLNGFNSSFAFEGWYKDVKK